MASTYTYALWKKKTASARVKLFEWKGDSMVNGLALSEYVTRTDLFETLHAPLKLCKVDGNSYFVVEVQGSGESSQVAAIAHGLSRALAEKEASHRTVLKAAGKTLIFLFIYQLKNAYY